MTDLVPRHEGRELPPAMAALGRGDLLLPYQQRAVELCSANRLLVVEKSRRVGLTWALAAYAVLKAGASREARGSDVLYISYKQEIAREFIDACAMWAKAFMAASADVDEMLFADQDEHGNTKSIQAFRIRFASGFEIVGLSAAPRTIRGKQGDVFIDEAAFVDNLSELLKAALALLMWGGSVFIVSTHNGTDNPFNELLDEIRSGRRKGETFKVTFDEAVADGLYERVRLVGGAEDLSKSEWIGDIRDFYGDQASEELDCIPAAGAGAWLPADLVIAAQSEFAGLPELYASGLCVIGRDIARRRDLAAMWVFEIVGRVLWLRERREMRNVSFTEQEQIFDGLMRRYRVLRAGVDQTGMGEGEVERAILKHGDRVCGILFTPAAKLDMAIAMKKRFEDGTIRLPDDAAIRADFRAIKRAKGTGDQVRLVNDTDEVHADMFWACALACKMADLGEPAYTGYRAAPRSNKWSDVPRGFEPDHGIGRMRMRPDERDDRRQRFPRGETW